MSTFTWDNAQKFVAVQLANFNDDITPPPGTNFMETQNAITMVTQSGKIMITQED